MLHFVIKLFRRPDAEESSEPVPASLAAEAKRRGIGLPDWTVEAAQLPIDRGETRLFGSDIDEPGADIVPGEELTASSSRSSQD